MVEVIPGRTRIAVLLGGWSREREVSLVSGRSSAEALRQRGHRVEEIDVGRDIARVLAAARPDVCLNMLHGKGGEDGCVQGVLETLEIPYTHSGVGASALGMDKWRSKAVLRDVGITVAESRLLPVAALAAGHPLPPPYVVKPNDEGSSIGVHFVRPGDPPLGPEALAAGEEGSGGDWLVERFVPGLELTVAVLGGRALEVTEIVAASGWYDYAAKYRPGGSRHELPARIPAAVRERALADARRAHAAIGCRGVSRADFRFDPDAGELVLLEVNTQPGMTPTSLVPEQAECVGMAFPELVEWLLGDASCRR